MNIKTIYSLHFKCSTKVCYKIFRFPMQLKYKATLKSMLQLFSDCENYCQFLGFLFLTDIHFYHIRKTHWEIRHPMQITSCNSFFKFPRIYSLTNFAPMYIQYINQSTAYLSINRAINCPTTCLLKHSDITNCNAHYLSALCTFSCRSLIAHLSRPRWQCSSHSLTLSCCAAH